MQVYIIEDEPLSLERLQKQLHEIDVSIHIAGTSDSIAGSVGWLQQNPPPDLILMDIELADGQSFEIFKTIEVQSAVIFTTYYDEYALKAFKVNSIDYLLKPVKKEELKKAIDKYKKLQHGWGDSHINIHSLIAELKTAQQLEYRSRFLVKQGQRLLAVEVSDIAYFFIDGRLCFFKTWDKAKYVVDYNLEELEAMLDPKYFFRLNRSFLAHLKAIGQMHTFFNGKLKIELKPAIDEEVLVSRERSQAFKDWMRRF
jgi:DNA-binding LytR/AlgR family response regulator